MSRASLVAWLQECYVKHDHFLEAGEEGLRGFALRSHLFGRTLYFAFFDPKMEPMDLSTGIILAAENEVATWASDVRTGNFIVEAQRRRKSSILYSLSFRRDPPNVLMLPWKLGEPPA